MKKINRREALSRAALLLGAAVSAPTATAFLSGCTAEPDAATSGGVLSGKLEELMASLCDHILPRTQTPSATEVGVPAFIHAVLKDCMPDEDRESFTQGLRAIDVKAGGFLDLDQHGQVAFLKDLDTEAKAGGDATTNAHRAWHRLKEMTVVGYFTSETGATEVLEYLPIPGRYDGCMPMPEGQRAWAT